MAIDLETGEIGNPLALFAKALERRHKQWDDRLAVGANRVKTWTRETGRRVTPTRFYRLMHDMKPY